MRLTSITLENFRCFEKEKIELHPQLNVFVGLNASGKTALLEGIGLGVGKVFSHLLGNNIRIEDSDIRQISDEKPSDSEKHTSIKCLGALGSSDLDCDWGLAYGNLESGLDSHLFQVERAKFSEGLEQRIEFDLPVLNYFSTDRHWGGEKSKLSQHQGVFNFNSRLAGYFESLSKKSNSLLFEKELEQMQLVVSQGKELGLPYDSSRLDLIRSLAAKAIENCKIFYYDYEKQSLAVIFNDGRRLTIDELSDGQKSLLLISTGIAFQCATLNPHLGLDAYKSNGIVLIDEVELHLHPEWQRRILPILTREFPNIQFICTTHSPQVLSMVDSECVQVIKDFHVQPLNRHTLGRDSNSLLSEIFGISKRPIAYANQLQEFYTFLEDQDFQKAEEILEDLQEKWGAMDAEIVRGWLFLQDSQEEVLEDSEEVA